MATRAIVIGFPAASGGAGLLNAGPSGNLEVGAPVAYYLVRATPKPDRLPRLSGLLAQDVFLHLRPFGRALTQSLTNARIGSNGIAVWEEEDYCSPPLAAFAWNDI